MNFGIYIYLKSIISLFAIVLLVNCSGDKKQHEKQKLAKSIELKKVDGTYLFDGKSLEGWEITQFGTQGPVAVYDGKIVLGYGDGCTGLTFTKDFPKLNY